MIKPRQGGPGCFATELQRASRERTLYVLDEPTTDLNLGEVDRLLVQLRGLVDTGHTVIVASPRRTSSWPATGSTRAVRPIVRPHRR